MSPEQSNPPPLAPVPPHWYGVPIAWVAVSTTPDPVSFLVYLFEFVGQFPDYPAIGMSGDKVALTFNDFACAEPCVSTLDGFYGSAFLIFDKAALLTGALLIATAAM